MSQLYLRQPCQSAPDDYLTLEVTNRGDQVIVTCYEGSTMAEVILHPDTILDMAEQIAQTLTD